MGDLKISIKKEQSYYKINIREDNDFLSIKVRKIYVKILFFLLIILILNFIYENRYKFDTKFIIVKTELKDKFIYTNLLYPTKPFRNYSLKFILLHPDYSDLNLISRELSANKAVLLVYSPLYKGYKFRKFQETILFWFGSAPWLNLYYNKFGFLITKERLSFKDYKISVINFLYDSLRLNAFKQYRIYSNSIKKRHNSLPYTLDSLRELLNNTNNIILYLSDGSYYPIHYIKKLKLNLNKNFLYKEFFNGIIIFPKSLYYSITSLEKKVYDLMHKYDFKYICSNNIYFFYKFKSLEEYNKMWLSEKQKKSILFHLSNKRDLIIVYFKPDKIKTKTKFNIKNFEQDTSLTIEHNDLFYLIYKK